jgi:hypothetical protein
LPPPAAVDRPVWPIITGGVKVSTKLDGDAYEVDSEVATIGSGLPL